MLRLDLQSTLKDLEDKNSELVVLKAKKDTTKGLSFLVLCIANKQTSGDASTNKQKDLRNMELGVEKIMDQSYSRLGEFKRCHERRIVILKKLAESTLKNLNIICFSHAFELANDGRCILPLNCCWKTASRAPWCSNRFSSKLPSL